MDAFSVIFSLRFFHLWWNFLIIDEFFLFLLSIAFSIAVCSCGWPTLGAYRFSFVTGASPAFGLWTAYAAQQTADCGFVPFQNASLGRFQPLQVDNVL
ncbi:hypothetical protein C0995_016716, partial [Termitomyces sp. Mi166